MDVSELRVLLVDDEEELVSALVERLGYRGIEAKYALNGPQAIEMVQRESFDVVVLDIKLPGMSGVEVHNVLRNSYPDLPVVLITGKGDIRSAVRAMKPALMLLASAKPVRARFGPSSTKARAPAS